MRVLVTGSNGLVGMALRGLAPQYPTHEFYFAAHEEADLTKEQSVKLLFSRAEPDCVIHTAARVGGIGMNLASAAQQFRDNILMNTHVIHEAYRHGVKKLIAFSSVCAYPANATLLSEVNLHDGEPYPAHYSYAYAKRMVDVQIGAYKKQYGVSYCSVIPGNIFGEYDNYDLAEGHVVPSLIHKCYLARKEEAPLKIWGTGVAKREFLYAKDVARVCLKVLALPELPQRLLVSGEKEYQIMEIALKIADLFNYHHILLERDKPDGQLSRPSDHTLFRHLFPDFKFTDIDKALKRSVQWFIQNYPHVRGVHENSHS